MKLSVIQVSDLHRSFHGQPVLKGINLHVSPHELTVIIGPSGSGKSTLLRCLNGLEVFDKGEVFIAGTHLKPDKNFHERAKHVRTCVGIVFQSFNLFPHLTVLENIVKAPIIVKKVARKIAEAEAKELLNKVGLISHLNHYPSQLSGGQQQRAAIARALAMSPHVMLYDEPTSSLDPGLVDEVLTVMKKLHEEGMTQIVVTHHMRFAKDVADKIAYIEDGKILEVSSPEKIFSTPSDERTRRFLKRFI